MSFEALAKIRSHTVTGGEHVGDIIWWTLSEARIARTLLETIWMNAGLSRDWLPEPPTPEKALKTAVKESLVGRAQQLARIGLEDDTRIVFAILAESRDGSGDVSIAQEARVTLNRQAPSQLESDHPGNELVQTIFAGYERLLTTYTADDIRRALLKALDACAAVTLRDSGGVYWIPAPYADTLRLLKDAVAQIGASRIDVVPIHATPEAKAALGDAARSSLSEEIGKLRVKIDGFLAQPPERASTLTRRLQAFEDLRAKARLYQTVLKVQVQDLESDLSKLTLQVEGLLHAKAA